MDQGGGGGGTDESHVTPIRKRGDSRGTGQHEEAQRGQAVPMAGLESDDDMGEAVSAASGASPGDEDEENLEFLYDDALEKGEDEGAGEGGGRSRGHIGRSPSGSSVTLSLPPSFDDSLDISPFLARFEGLESTPVMKKIMPTATRGSEQQMLQSRILELESQVEHLTHGRRMMESHLMHEREQWGRQLQEVEEKRRKEVNALRETQSNLETEMRAYRMRLDDQRSLFRDLEISDSLYMELCRKREEELSLKEWVAMRTHAQVKAIRDELEKTRRNLQDTQDTVTSVSEQLELHVLEANRNKRSAEARETTLRKELGEAERRIREQEHLLEEALNRLKSMAERDQSFERVHSRMQSAEREIGELKSLVETQALALATTTESEKTLQKRVADLSHHNEILLMDKTFLAKEAEMAARRAEAAEKDMDRNAEKVRDLKRRKEELQAALSEARDQATVAYEEKLNTELGRLREESAKELADLKTTSREMLERENKALREARQDALAEADRARAQLAELSKAHEDLVFRLSRCESSYEGTLSELRGELKIKAFELSRMGVTQEEKIAALKQAELQISMLKAQLELHEKEFARLEATSGAKISELHALVQMERDKVRGYEELEAQLDDAIVRTGMHEGGEVAASMSVSGIGGASRGLAATFDTLLPTAPQRRMKHAVHLAQKLGQAERELNSARQQLKDVRGRLERAEQQNDEMARLLEHASQPGRYVVELVREKDRDLDHLRERIADLEHQVQESGAEVRRLTEEKADLQAELGRLVNQRDEIKSLRLLLQELQSQEAQPHEEGLEARHPSDVGMEDLPLPVPQGGGWGDGPSTREAVLTPLGRRSDVMKAHPELELVLQGSVGRTPKWHRSFKAE